MDLNNFIMFIKKLMPKKYNAKRLLPKKRKTWIKKSFMLILALLAIPVIIVISNIKKNINLNVKSKQPTSRYEDIKDETLEILNQEQRKKFAYNYENNVIEDENAILETITDEFILEEVENNLNPIVEIALLLEKNNLTYEELIELASSPRYSTESEKIYGNIDIPKNQLIDLLSGNRTNFRDTLFIGDSRTQGMLLSGAIEESNTVYGVGYGYNWFIGNGEFSSNKTNALNGAINGIEAKMQDNHLYNIVIWLGVNDYSYISANTYFDKFASLAASDWHNYNIYIVSVGPVKDSRAQYVNNAGINDFNSKLSDLISNSGLSNLNYINLNYQENSINNYDGAGVHYGASDYQNIHSIVTETISSKDFQTAHDILNLFYSILKDYDTIMETKVNSTGPILSRRQFNKGE